MTTKTIKPGPAALPEPEALLTPAEVARLFKVDVKTVTRWANTGRLGHIRTLGGSRRYPAAPLLAMLEATRVPGPDRT